YGPLSWSVPGCVSGWEALHREFGKLPLGDLLAPTIAYAHDGFPVTEVIAMSWAMAKHNLRKSPGAFAAYYPDAKAVQAGRVVRQYARRQGGPSGRRVP